MAKHRASQRTRLLRVGPWHGVRASWGPWREAPPGLCSVSSSGGRIRATQAERVLENDPPHLLGKLGAGGGNGTG